METETLTGGVNIFSNIEFLPFQIETFWGFIALIAMLIISALISGSEVAYFSLSPQDIEKLKDEDRASDRKVLQLINIPERLLATILIGNNFVNIAIVLLSSYITNSVVDFSNNLLLGFIVQTILITAVILLFGEIIPKVYASYLPVKLARFMSSTLVFLDKIFKPLSTILIVSTNVVNKRVKSQAKMVSVSELSQALELTDDREISEDKDILEGIIKFGDRSASEVMQARIDMIAIDIEVPFTKVISVIKESGFSRIPIYSGTYDNIKGVIYSKDLIEHLHKGGTFQWRTVMRPPLFVPETKKIDDLLEEFRKSKVHMAIVVDEYGGTSGLITLEDVLEEIVGDISDEFDEVEQLYTIDKDGAYIFEGRTSLIDFCRSLDISEDIFESYKGDSESLAGLLLELKGVIPKVKEEITCEGYLFEVKLADEKRIKEIKVTLPSAV